MSAFQRGDKVTFGTVAPSILARPQRIPTRRGEVINRIPWEADLYRVRTDGGVAVVSGSMMRPA